MIRPDFVPLASETVRYLSRDLSSGQLSTQLNSSLHLELNGDGPSLHLPQGERKGLSRANSDQTVAKNERGWQISELKCLGHHQILGPSESNDQILKFKVRRFYDACGRS